ncbi:MAG: hypothetical protein HWE16_06920 [Gammaproteobacteria bacterium]|nr:hypothetical protein [Gammaproteobacteria bacterium]
MHIEHQWPDFQSLPMSIVSQDSLRNYLIEPFGDEVFAKSFWRLYPCTLIIIEASDTKETLEQLDTETLNQFYFATQYPEYTEALCSEFTVKLSIINDEGAGIYLVINNRSELLTFDRPDSNRKS